jgi:RimJ/RimL family protein N-acetyltransferase
VRNPFLIGPRLYLRAPELDELDDLIRWVTHPDVRRHLSRRFPLNRVQEEGWLRGLDPQRDVVLVLVLRESQRAIGCAGLHGLGGPDRQAELGIAIGEPDAWGQGYGREAIELLLGYGFDELGLHRVHLNVWATNARAIACYERLGFVREGLRREVHWQDGAWIDGVLMSLLDREWAARPERKDRNRQ